MTTIRFLSFSILLTSGLLACQVPVFRFALERWPADNFRLLVASSGPVDKNLKSQLDDLQKSLETDTLPVNLELEVIDLTTLTEAQRISLPGFEHLGEEPSMVLIPPKSWQTDEPAWRGAATAENLARLLDSPARQRCADHILKGETAVWIVVECGDPEKNSRAKALLAAGLARASSLLEIPTGVVRREDLNPSIENIDLDDVLRSDIPLKISFVTETISRQDPAEAIFLPILVEPEVLRSDEPLIVPVFGRGRTPGALPASELSVERLLGACEYLCGACSCQVKQGNPGYDLLLKTDWDGRLNSAVITADSEIVQKALDVVSFNPPETVPPSHAAPPQPASMVATTVGIAAIALGAIVLVALRNLGTAH